LTRSTLATLRPIPPARRPERATSSLGGTVKSTASNYTITFTDDEALILFDWLARFEDGESVAPGLTDTAEERVFWVVEGQLQSQLTRPLDPNYKSFSRKLANVF
jgi:hypothetical protein